MRVTVRPLLPSDHTSVFFKVTKYQESRLRDYLRGELCETVRITAKSV